MQWNSTDAYGILDHLSKIHTPSSHAKEAPTWTPRLLAIKDILESSNITYSVEHFRVNGFSGDREFTNIYTTFQGVDPDQPSLVFLAHHDIANPGSQNCQDNTASISHLIKMMLHLNENPPNRTVHIMLVDTEEHVNIRSCGSQVLAEAIKAGRFGPVEFCINLELTGLGQNVWASSYQHDVETAIIHMKALEAKPVGTPFNDAAVLGYHGVPAMCIGILPDDDWNSLMKGQGYPNTWALCHSHKDTIDLISQDDMAVFTNKLLSLC